MATDTSYSMQHSFAYPWRVVAQAFWLKYPHPSLPHVKEALVLSREIDSQGRLVTKRVITVQQKVPRPLQSFTGGLDRFHAMEITVVDPALQVLESTSHNLSFSRVMQAVTTASYVPNQDSTEFTSTSTVHVHKFPRIIAKRIELSSSQSASKNAVKGLETLELLCNTRHFA